MLRQRARLSRRWQRRRRWQAAFLGLTLTGLAGTFFLVVAFFVVPPQGHLHRVIEQIALGGLLLVMLGLSSIALWRYDRVRRRLRSAYIRLQHVDSRLASLPGDVDGVPDEGPIA